MKVKVKVKRPTAIKIGTHSVSGKAFVSDNSVTTQKLVDGAVTEEKLASNLKEKLNNKQDKLVFDTAPTANSTNPVMSGGVKSALDGKADKYTEDGGFVAGEGASNYVYNAKSGIAIGKTAESENGGVSIGYNSWTGQGVSIGYNSGGNGVTIGKNASAYTEAGNPLDAIQLGTGTNGNEFSMQVYDYQLLANDATTKSATDGSKYLKDVGKLSSLTTTDKTDIVSAINEVKSNSGKVTANGGFAAGNGASAGSGGAIGNSAYTISGGVVGEGAFADGAGGAVGYGTYVGDGFAGGKNAKSMSDDGPLDAIQLGAGTNGNEFSMQVYDYQLLANDAETKSATDGSKYLKDVGKLSSLATSVKDNIVNAINSIVTLLSQKVDKVNGKGLSANDYTDEEKEKLINLPAKTELDSDLEGKQDKLVFDSEPTYNSDNSVTSGVIKGALDGKVDKQTDNGGFVGGKDAKSVKQGVAIGYKSETRDSGVAIGALSSSLKHGSAVGYGSYVTGNGGAVGMYAVTGHGFAGGESARTVSSSGMAIDAVQLGNGANSNEFTMQVYDYQLLADDATTKSSTDGGKYLKDVGKLSSLATSVKDNIVNAVNSLVAAHNDLKLKSVPHKDVSGYPVTLADHLADEEFIKCNVYGGTGGIGNLDSTDGKYKIPVTLTGKNILPYPYKDSSKTGNGINFTDNGDGSVSLTGTATGKATYYFTRSLRLKKRNLYIVGNNEKSKQ